MTDLLTRGVRRVTESPPDPRLARFENLFACHHDDVLRYFVRRLDIRADAADLVAETFLIAWRRLDGVPDGEVLPWLYGVARRVLSNHYRGETRRHGLADRLRDDLRTAPATEPAASELHHAAESFRQLSETDREVSPWSPGRASTRSSWPQRWAVRGMPRRFGCTVPGAASSDCWTTPRTRFRSEETTHDRQDH